MFEYIYPTRLIQKHAFYAFVLGLFYAFLGIAAALLIFPEDPAIVAVAFAAILFLPTMNEFLKKEEKIEAKRKKFNLFFFYKDHKDVLKIYSFYFIGVLITFSLCSIFLPSLATNYIFEHQVNALSNTSGMASEAYLLNFNYLFTNNISVLFLCFLTSLIFSDGAVFLITWNASVWGTIFAMLAKTAALNVHKDPLIYFLLVIIIVFPHMMLEAFSYFSAALSGGVFSKAIFKENFRSERFYYILKNVVVLLVFSLIVLFCAVSIETYVIQNSGLYSTITMQSFLL